MNPLKNILWKDEVTQFPAQSRMMILRKTLDCTEFSYSLIIIETSTFSY